MVLKKAAGLARKSLYCSASDLMRCQIQPPVLDLGHSAAGKYKVLRSPSEN
ncbi:MAG TPA: hypothetical protein V6D28_24825 [Leptolyngbyaceae cyanobacterium]